MEATDINPDQSWFNNHVPNWKHVRKIRFVPALSWKQLIPKQTDRWFTNGNRGLVTSIMRFVSFANLNYYGDVTWDAVNPLAWTCIEPGIYLIASCLPTLRPLVVLVWRSKHNPISSSSANRTQGRSGSRKTMVRPKERGFGRIENDEHELRSPLENTDTHRDMGYFPR